MSEYAQNYSWAHLLCFPKLYAFGRIDALSDLTALLEYFDYFILVQCSISKGFLDEKLTNLYQFSWNSFDYSRIFPNAFNYLLFPKLGRHNTCLVAAYRHILRFKAQKHFCNFLQEKQVIRVIKHLHFVESFTNVISGNQ